MFSNLAGLMIEVTAKEVYDNKVFNIKIKNLNS